MRAASMKFDQNARKSVVAKTRQTSATQLKTRKSIAKIGMSGSLGALFVSGFFKFHGAKQLHIYSGFGLLAFSLWHHFLNQPKPKSKT
ncbi:MAG: hypothetical protein QNJ02_14410 [Desulfobacterales bacterium]|nr:hypothetical protein [Desulfobacterales bacterium]